MRHPPVQTPQAATAAPAARRAGGAGPEQATTTPRDAAQQRRIVQAFGPSVAQAYAIAPTEKNPYATELGKRQAEWPGGADDMVAWAKSWKQMLAVLKGYTHAQWLQIQALFPGGLEQVTVVAIDNRVAQERERIDRLTPLAGRVLKAHALADSMRIIAGPDLNNPQAVQHLQALDPDMTHWEKRTTPMYAGNTGDKNDDYAVHFYYNTVTQQVCTTRDYKKKYRDDRFAYI